MHVYWALVVDRCCYWPVTGLGSGYYLFWKLPAHYLVVPAWHATTTAPNFV